MGLRRRRGLRELGVDGADALGQRGLNMAARVVGKDFVSACGDAIECERRRRRPDSTSAPSRPSAMAVSMRPTCRAVTTIPRPANSRRTALVIDHAADLEAQYPLESGKAEPRQHRQHIEDAAAAVAFDDGSERPHHRTACRSSWCPSPCGRRRGRSVSRFAVGRDARVVHQQRHVACGLRGGGDRRRIGDVHGKRDRTIDVDGARVAGSGIDLCATFEELLGEVGTEAAVGARDQRPCTRRCPSRHPALRCRCPSTGLVKAARDG